MTRKIVLAIGILSNISTYAQNSFLKAGFNVNADVVDHEISLSANLLGDHDYGTSGFIKSGIRFFYGFEKTKTIKDKK